jgi:hypothetical protein
MTAHQRNWLNGPEVGFRDVAVRWKGEIFGMREVGEQNGREIQVI